MSKICFKCGNTIQDNMAFCNKCGSKVTDNNTNYGTANQGFRNVQYSGNTYSQNNHKGFSNMIVENTETIQGELKNSMMKNVLMGGGWISNRIFFTEKRFYFKSKSLTGNVKDFIVDLKDISAAEIAYRNPIGFLLGAVIFLIMFIVQLVNENGNLSVLIGIFIFVILYFLFRCTVLRIYFNGGRKSMPLRMYSYHDVENFHKKLCYVKSK